MARSMSLHSHRRLTNRYAAFACGHDQLKKRRVRDANCRADQGEANLLSWTGTSAAAARSSRNSVCWAPRAPAAGTWTGPAPESARRTAPAFSLARGEDPHLGRGADRRQRQRQPDRRRLGGAAYGHHGPLFLVERRQPWKERRHVGVGADAEHQHVEPRHAAPDPAAQRRRAATPRSARRQPRDADRQARQALASGARASARRRRGRAGQHGRRSRSARGRRLA